MITQASHWSPSPMALVGLSVAGTAIAGFVGRTLARRRVGAMLASGIELRSTPDYYAWYALSIMFTPSAALTMAAFVLQALHVYETPAVLYAALWLVLPGLLAFVGIGTIRPGLNARRYVEQVIHTTLLVAALISILTTAGILLSVLFEAIRFFEKVDPLEFLTGTTWAPGGAFLEGAGRGAEGGTESHFGALPLFAGTFMITGIAMLVAVPVGLLSATFMSEYASKHFRRGAKPMLEILAGIPTVVYGFFAVITVAPAIVRACRALGIEDVSYQNAIAPGAIMGVMIIPFMSSLCDDVMTAVPQNLRNASLALGATKSETIKRVVLPAAFPGIISAFLLSVSRAVGETMIVVMAAGLQANLTANPLKQMTTVTVHIVANLTGDLAYDNPQTLSAFGLGLTLLVLTLVLNVVSVIVIRKFRQRYEAD
jgi:phosphate transport system permease protein